MLTHDAGGRLAMSAIFATHEVLNQPPPLDGVNLFTSDAALKDDHSDWRHELAVLNLTDIRLTFWAFFGTMQELSATET